MYQYGRWKVQLFVSYPEISYSEARTFVFYITNPASMISLISHDYHISYYKLFIGKHPSQLHIGPTHRKLITLEGVGRSWAFRLSPDPSVDSDTELMSVNGKTLLR
jgi:hypothetical protein